MENKSIDSTPQRPEGNRLVDAALVEMDLSAFIGQIKAETTWVDSNHNSITIFKTDSMRIVLMGLHENAEVKPHTENGVISIQVLEGKVNFVTDKQTVTIEKGKIIALHDNMLHSLQALSESFLLLTLVVDK